MMDTNTSFHIFSQLPTELRLKIWFFALNEIRRVVEIECDKGIGPRYRRYVKSFASTTPAPALMNVNQESRSEALAIYQPYFKTKLCPTGIYVAFDRDTIAFPDGVIQHLEEPELQAIQSMILEYAYFGHYNIDTVRSMRKLKTLELRVETGQLFSWDLGDNMLALANQLREEEELHPELGMPSIRIVSKHTGEIVLY
jgi:hypothetical protein